MFQWVVLFHELAALAFMAAHGFSIAATFRLKSATTPEEARPLLNHSRLTMNAVYGSFLAVSVTGLAAGLWFDWWRTGWYWASAVILLAITGAMVPLAAAPFNRMRSALGLPYRGSPKDQQPQTDLAAMHSARAQLRPLLLSIIAFGGVALLVYLMRFKPF